MTRSGVAAGRRQVATLHAYIRTGTVKAAAHELGVTDSVVRRRLSAYCVANETNLPAAIYELGRKNAQIVHLERGARIRELT